jgi:hypothetical protein
MQKPPWSADVQLPTAANNKACTLFCTRHGTTGWGKGCSPSLLVASKKPGKRGRATAEAKFAGTRAKQGRRAEEGDHPPPKH